MKLTFENTIVIAILILAEAWFLHGFFHGRPDFEPAIAFIAALGTVFFKDPIKEKFFSSNADNNNIHDKNLFEEFQSALPFEPTIRVLKEHDFGGSFGRSTISPLQNFVATWDSVEKEFLNKKLEKMKNNLYAEALTLATEINRRTVPVRGNDLASVYSDNQRTEGGPRPQSVVDDARFLNEKASEFVPKYEAFVRYARKLLLE